jgi:hypothetical protein
MDPASKLPPDARLGRQQLYDFYTKDPAKLKNAIKEVVNRQGPEVISEFGTKGYRSVVVAFMSHTYGYCWKTHDFVPPHAGYELYESCADGQLKKIYSDYEMHAMKRLAVKITGDFSTGKGDFLHQKHITAYLQSKLRHVNSKCDSIHQELSTSCGNDTHGKLHKLFKKIFDGKFLSADAKEKKHAELKMKKEAHETYLKSPQYPHDQFHAKRKENLEAYEKLRSAICVKIPDEEVPALIEEAEHLDMPLSDRGKRIVTQIKAFIKTELQTKKTREFNKNPLPEYALTESGPNRLDMSYLVKGSLIHTFMGKLLSFESNKTKAAELFKTLTEQDAKLRQFDSNIVLIAPTPLEDPKPKTTDDTNSVDTADLQPATPKTADPAEKTSSSNTKAADKTAPKPQTSFWSWLYCIPNGIKNFFKWLFGF